MGLDSWDEYIYGPGIYYWRSYTMAKQHFIMLQIAEYKFPDDAPGRLHVEMLLPVGGSAYDYNYSGPIENMPDGEYWGPIEMPDSR